MRNRTHRFVSSNDFERVLRTLDKYHIKFTYSVGYSDDGITYCVYVNKIFKDILYSI